MRRKGLIASFGSAAVLVLPVISTASASPALDPYAPLQLYAGKWSMRDSAGGSHLIDDHCARTGLFFVCEQVVDGKAEDLVVFLPTGSGPAGLAYRTQALAAEGKDTHPWYTLTIDGDRWTYGGEVGASGASHDRTLNRFFGRDHIHFDVQTSRDGKTWTTTLSGEETRVR